MLSRYVRLGLIALVVIYIISPFDFVPDFAPVIGWLDDLAILAVAANFLSNGRMLAWFLKKARAILSGTHGYQETGRAYEWQAEDWEKNRPQQPPQAPHEVLGVKEEADWDEIHAAWRRLAKEYHPDRAAHLGPELRELAEKKFKQINQAYEILKKERKPE